MSNPKTIATPKDWKEFRLEDGTIHRLPPDADKPLKISRQAKKVLRELMQVKPPKDWRKVITTGRKVR
jgi:hypothetical protein